MYIEEVPNRNSPPAILVRESKRVGKIVKKRTLANITKWPQNVIAGLRMLVQGVELVPKDVFTTEKTTPHGHVEAILGTIRKLKLDNIIFSKPCRERNLVLAMIAGRLIFPCSKLATTRIWHTTTLAEELSVQDADVDELYEAMDWLLSRQGAIEKKLAKAHLAEDELVLYDISSSYYEGHKCPLVFFGHSRDGKKGLPIIVYGVMTDNEGRPVAVEVYPGNTGDPTTVPDQVNKLIDKFGLKHITLVGDRGMLTQTKISLLKDYPGIGWLSALKGKAIQKLVDNECLQLSLFDKQNLAEISSPDYPGERLIACFNPLLKDKRSFKRTELLKATEEKLDGIKKTISRRTKKLLSKDEIGVKVGKVLNKFKMSKHYILKIEDNFFEWKRNNDAIQDETNVDGVYVIRTSEPKTKMSAEDAVRNYKSLSHVERVFQCMKGIDIRVRPIRHHTEDHVRAHILICMLAYYVEWHMRKALAPILFEDEELDEDRKTRDPVAPAEPSESVKAKKAGKKTVDGLQVHSFNTLIQMLATRTKNRCRTKSIPDAPAFYNYTEPNQLQTKAFQLLGLDVPSR